MPAQAFEFADRLMSLKIHAGNRMDCLIVSKPKKKICLVDRPVAGKLAKSGDLCNLKVSDLCKIHSLPHTL